MNKVHAMHPADGSAKLSPHPSDSRFVHPRIRRIVVYQLKQFASVDVFKHKAVAILRREGMQVRDDIRMRNMLQGMYKMAFLP